MCRHCDDAETYVKGIRERGTAVAPGQLDRVKYQLNSLHHDGDCGPYELALEESDTAPLIPLTWYGPYSLDNWDALQVIAGCSRLHIRHHECDDPADNGGCGHLEPLQELY